MKSRLYVETRATLVAFSLILATFVRAAEAASTLNSGDSKISRDREILEIKQDMLRLERRGEQLERVRTTN